MSESEKISKIEIQAGISLALIFFLRMFGLFLIVPVFSLFAIELDEATPFLIGLALGIYGLTQALFQIPFGFFSDKLGRKPIITVGLCLFITGSIICAFSDNIYLMILGRAVQGSGAVAAVIIALASDLSRPIHRTKIMAMIGMMIGLAFSLAFVLSPILSSTVGVKGLFLIVATLASLAIILLYSVVPKLETAVSKELESGSLMVAISNLNLLRLNVGIFVLHMSLMANFVVIPLNLQEIAGIPLAQHWRVYLPVIVLSMIFVSPMIMLADKKGNARQFFLAAIVLLVFAQWLMVFFSTHLWHMTITLVIFFTAFNFLEASLPSLVSKTVTPHQKGTALGIYSSCQFIGTFIGGITGGYLYGQFGLVSVYLFSGCMSFLWLIFAWDMPKINPEEKIAATTI